MNSRLLRSAELFKIGHESEVPKLGDLEVTECGSYYLRRFMHYFEYITFMKDDVDYPSGVAIRDCIEQRGVTERFAGSAAFVSFLFEQELAFVRTGRGRMQRELYMRKFGPVEVGVFYSLGLTQSLREWGHP